MSRRVTLYPVLNVSRFLGALLGAILTFTLLSGVPSASAAKNPENDRARLPRECADPKQQLPQRHVFCEINTYQANRPTVMLWGDSHAFMLLPALKKAAQGKNVNLVAVVLGSCPPVLTHPNPRKRPANRSVCEAAGDTTFDKIREAGKGAPLKVVMSLNWDYYLSTLEIIDAKKSHAPAYVFGTARSFRKGTPRLFSALSRQNLPIDVVAPVGRVPEKRKTCRRGETPYECALPRRKVINKEANRQAYVRRLTSNLGNPSRVINLNDKFCNRRKCRGRVRHGNRKIFTFYDDFHLSATMARAKMSGKFTGTVRDAVNSVPGQ